MIEVYFGFTQNTLGPLRGPGGATYPDLEQVISAANADHLAVKNQYSNATLLNNAVHVATIRQATEMAAAVGDPRAAVWAAKYERAKEQFSQAFVHPDGYMQSITGTGTSAALVSGGRTIGQAAYALAYYHGILTDADAALLDDAFVQTITDTGSDGPCPFWSGTTIAAWCGGYSYAPDDYYHTTGYAATGSLLGALSMRGQSDHAYTLLERTEFPSFLYPVTKGATGIWESWDQDWNSLLAPTAYNSFSQPPDGAMGSWMNQYMVGIDNDSTPGWNTFVLQPTIGGSFTFANGSRHTHVGTIESGWTANTAGLLTYSACVPANTMANLYLPVAESALVDFADLPGIVEYQGMKEHNGQLTAAFTVVSGCINFEVTNGKLSVDLADGFKPVPTVLDLTVAPAEKVYGDSDPDFELSGLPNGWVNGVDYTVDFTRVPGETVGDYQITATVKILASGYTLGVITPGDLTIKVCPLSVVIAERSAEHTGSPLSFDLPVVAVGLRTGDSLATLTVSVTGTDIGTYWSSLAANAVQIVRGTDDVSSNYEITVTQGKLTITEQPPPPPTPISGLSLEAASKVYGDADPKQYVAIGWPDDTWVLGVDYGLSFTRDPGENVGPYTVTTLSLTILRDGYVLEDSPSDIVGTLTITPKDLVVTVGNAQLKYSGSALTADLPVSAVGLRNGDVLDTTTTAVTGTKVGEYPSNLTPQDVQVTRDGVSQSGNYTITIAQGKLTIVSNPAEVQTGGTAQSNSLAPLVALLAVTMAVIPAVVWFGKRRVQSIH
jgi:hypothetical protein